MSTDEASPSASQQVTTEEFGTMLIKFFKPYVEMNKSIDETDCIRRSLEFFSEHLNCQRMADVYMEVIFSLFECFRCTNSDLIGNALAEYSVRKLKAYDKIEQHLEFKSPSLLTRFPINEIVYSIAPGYMKILTIDSIFYQQFLFQDFEAVQRLLRYGVPFKIEDFDTYFFPDWMLRSFIDSYLPLPYRLPHRREKGVDEERYSNLMASYTSCASRRRLYFVLLGTMSVIMMKKIGNLQKYKILVNSIKLVFETIPDPPIHVKEIGRFLNLVLVNENKKAVIKEYYRIFTREFRTSTMPVQPRSLMHLCRCRVRDCLINTKKLPHGVWSFEIPNEMKNYILIQDREDDYHSQYVSALTGEKPMRNSKRKRTLSSD